MKILKHYLYEILLGVAIVAFIAVFSYISILRMQTFNSHYFDLGIMNQVSYNTSQGRFLEMTNQELKRNTSRLAIHFDPILALFSPFYYIHSGPEVLLIGQALCIALGAIPLYLIAAKLTKKKYVAFIFAISYLLYFPIQRATLFDFHAVTMAVPFIFAMMYLALIKRYKASLIFMVLALLTKENVGLVTFMVGLYFFVFQKERKYGLIAMAISAVVFVATVFMIIPYYRQAAHFALRYFGDYGDTPGKIILGIFQHPIITVQKILSPDSLTYLQRMLLGNGILILAAPLEFLLGLPDLLIILLSSNSNMKAIYFHYSAVLVVFVYFSAIVGYTRIAKRVPRIYANSILVIVILLNIWTMYQFNPGPKELVKEPLYLSQYNAKKLKAVQAWSNKLGDSVKVATTPQLAPFFSARQYYYNFLFDPSFYSYGIPEDDIIKEIANYEHADYVIVAKSELHDDMKILTLFHEHLKSNIKYARIVEDNDIEVYKKLNK
ncbi:MAG: hypothetical protein RI947_648 [Candidatus Parcubacteria bacterium]|jgi:uncharacterized membrane protein